MNQVTNWRIIFITIGITTGTELFFIINQVIPSYPKENLMNTL